MGIGQIIGGAAMVAIGILVVGFGIKTYESLPPDTPVLIAFNDIGTSSGLYLYATMDCVRDGHVSATYLPEGDDLRGGAGNPFTVTGTQTQWSTLRQARRLAHDKPRWYAADPACAGVDGFHQESRLLFSWID